MTTSIDAPATTELRDQVRDAARRARGAARELALANSDTKNAVLHGIQKAEIDFEKLKPGGDPLQIFFS